MKQFIEQASLNETSIKYLVYKLNEVIRVVNNKPDIHDFEYWTDTIKQFEQDGTINTYTDLLEALKKKPDFNQVRDTVRDELIKYVDQVNQRIYQPTLDQLLRVIGDGLQEYIKQHVDDYLDKATNDLRNRLSTEIIHWN
ncbi:MAG: hypothetical protein HG453_004865 [Clostridiales bacterium]|jgi:hypothetical protein|nr:hypothetical protein [Clostridiales bacterium]DAN68884.1 MAG TPA: hypothetical protein [Caudoviricetes sp.]